MLEKIVEIVKRAGDISLEYFGKIRNDDIEFKGDNDLVTKADLEVQDFLKKDLQDEFPQADFLGEEGEHADTISNKFFIADPIDGTTNFAYGHPFYSISLAYSEEGIIKSGAVYAPALDLMYYAERDRGAFCNDKKIHVSDTKILKNSLAATGFACVFRGAEHNNVELFNSVITKLRGIRRYGSAAIDLCFTAQGKFDLYWEYNLNIWDIAAGVLIVQEAGGKVTDFSGGSDYMQKKQLFASNGQVHEEFLAGSREFAK
jgi:myo-inositol-1(or 4)-monophosphatase